jgi:glycerophosphoryl diester phosphodiesterase
MWLNQTRFYVLAFLTASWLSNAAHADEARPCFVVAHRGLLLDAPENTLANFRACLELRLGFELDVQRSRDGHLVCVHDTTVDRTTDGTGRVSQLTLKALKSLDAGSWFNASFRAERIPTLDEVFKLLGHYRESPVLIAVDFKGDDAQIERDVVALADRHDVLDHLLMIGRTIQAPEVRKRLRLANPKTHVATVANNPAEFPTALKDPDSDWVYVRYVPSADEVSAVHAKGRRMFIAGSTVAGLQHENWRVVVERGMDAILTDYSIELSRQIRSTPR